MNTLFVTSGGDHEMDMASLCIVATKKYGKTCYITFNEAYQFVIGMLDDSPVDKEQFVVIDASKQVKQKETISNRTFVVSVDDLFNVYLFLRQLIDTENIDHILMDSISSLIQKHGELPLKEMMTDLLLEVGRASCDTSLVVTPAYANHDVVQHIKPLLHENITM